MPVASILADQPPKSADRIIFPCSGSTSGRPGPHVLNAPTSYPNLLSLVCLLCLPGHRRPILICAAAGPLPDLSSPCGYFFWYVALASGHRPPNVPSAEIHSSPPGCCAGCYVGSTPPNGSKNQGHMRYFFVLGKCTSWCHPTSPMPHGRVSGGAVNRKTKTCTQWPLGVLGGPNGRNIPAGRTS